MNNNIIKILSVVAVVLLCFVFYKLGDKNGYREGFDVGYSYDCRDDLRKVTTYAAKTRSAVDSVNRRIEKIRQDVNVPDSLKWESFGRVDDIYSREHYYTLSNLEKVEFKKQYLEKLKEDNAFYKRASEYMKNNNTKEYREDLPNGMGYRGVTKLGR